LDREATFAKPLAERERERERGEREERECVCVREEFEE
jgi:hypothetical protein